MEEVTLEMLNIEEYELLTSVNYPIRMPQL